jgi:hypothetical protein
MSNLSLALWAAGGWAAGYYPYARLQMWADWNSTVASMRQNHKDMRPAVMKNAKRGCARAAAGFAFAWPVAFALWMPVWGVILLVQHLVLTAPVAREELADLREEIT